MSNAQPRYQPDMIDEPVIGADRRRKPARDRLDGLDPKDRKDVLTMAGRQLATMIGSGALLEMLAHSGKSMRQVARESGFDVSVLSNIANGKRASGPELWTLMALAEAMDLDLHLDVRPR
jgi:hypothetical protein